MVGDYPTALQRSGDLAALVALNGGPIIDPTTVDPMTGLGGTAFTTDIPVHPLSASWLNSWIPLPNQPGVAVGDGNYSRAVPRNIDYDTYVARVDHEISRNIRMFGRFIYTNTSSSQRGIAPAEFNRNQQRPNHNVAVSYIQTISPNFLVEGRFGYHRWWMQEPIGSDGDENFLAELGVSGSPGFTQLPDSALAPPRIPVTGFAQFGHFSFGRPRTYWNDHQYYDVLFFKTQGSHAMKFGAGLIRSRADFPENILSHRHLDL